MANHSVSDLSLIDQQVRNHEKMREFLLKAEAVATVALNKEFIENEHPIIYHYLWVLFDLICGVKEINESTIDTLIKIKDHN